MTISQGTNGIIGDVFAALESEASIEHPDNRTKGLKLLPAESIRARTPVGWNHDRVMQELTRRGWHVAHFSGKFYMAKEI